MNEHRSRKPNALWCQLRALSFVLPSPPAASNFSRHSWLNTGRGFNVGELHKTLGWAAMMGVSSDEYVYGAGQTSAAVYAIRGKANRPDARVDVVVRCADDPYVLAAAMTGLSYDFGDRAFPVDTPSILAVHP